MKEREGWEVGCYIQGEKSKETKRRAYEVSYQRKLERWVCVRMVTTYIWDLEP